MSRAVEELVLELLRGPARAGPGIGPSAETRLATVVSLSDGRPVLLFDGEDTPSTRTYPRLSSYTPTAGDRVLVVVHGGSAVVLGKIV